MIFLFNTIEIIVGKGENTGYQHFLLFPQWFQKATSYGVVKSGLCGKGLNNVESGAKQHSIIDQSVDLVLVSNTK